MGLPDPVTQHEEYTRQLHAVLEQLSMGDPEADPPAVDHQLVRSLGALLRLQQTHRIDDHSRCGICRSAPRGWWWPWPKRTTCTVHNIVGFFLRQPDWAVRTILAHTHQPCDASLGP